MRISLVLIVVMLFSVAGSCLAQGQVVKSSPDWPFDRAVGVTTRRILPEDIVQDSIQMFRFTTNRFVVRWTYTEAGAKKMVAFREAYEGQKVCLAVGSFQSPIINMGGLGSMPVTSTNYTKWKDGWLKIRTDKYFGVTEDDAKKIVAGLKIK